jgi:hypothetical protein
MKNQGAAGLTQSFRLIRFKDAQGLEAEDLLERTDDGTQVRPDMQDKVVEDRHSRNKWTRRGLTKLLWTAFSGHGGSGYNPPEVTYAPSNNCFAALFAMADDPTLDRSIAGDASDSITKSGSQVFLANGDFTGADVGKFILIGGGSNEGNKGWRQISQVLGGNTIVASPYGPMDGFAWDAAENFGGVQVWANTRPGDARANWNESDGQFDSVIGQGQASGKAVSEFGSRACLRTDSAVSDFRFVSVSYVTTAPYREIEYVFYARAATVARELVGDPSDSIFARNNTVTMVNGSFTGADIGRIFKVSGASAAGNNGQRRITVVLGGTQIQTDGQYEADAYEDFMEAASQDGVYNAGVETGYKGLDYLPIKSLGLAEGIACGSGEASNRIGIRTVVGLAPTFQGVCDRTYVHEGTGLHQYLGTETLGTFGDGYVASSSVGDFTGDKAFDGYVQGEGLTGMVDLGSRWESAVGSNHVIGRTWSTATAKKLTGIRIVSPQGGYKNNCPDNFYIQFLDASKAGGVPANLQPANDSHWTTIGSQYTSQADAIFGNAQYGVEYTFSLPGSADAYGVRLYNLNSYVGGSSFVEVAELYAFTAGPTVAFVAGATDQMRIANKSSPLASDFRNFYFGGMSTASIQAVADTMNKKLRGFQAEALRSSFGFLWVRGTVQGGNGAMTIDTVADGSTANTPLQLPVSAVHLTGQGTTQPTMKLPADALAIIYRFSLSGDLPTS